MGKVIVTKVAKIRKSRNHKPTMKNKIHCSFWVFDSLLYFYKHEIWSLFIFNSCKQI